MENNNLNENQNINQVGQNTQTKKKPNTVLIIVLATIGGIIVFIALIIFMFAVVFTTVSTNSNKLVCESTEGNITIMYNDENITGYIAKGLTYDLDGQKRVAKELGVENYISEFIEYFEDSTEGTCRIENK